MCPPSAAHPLSSRALSLLITVAVWSALLIIANGQEGRFSGGQPLEPVSPTNYPSIFTRVIGTDVYRASVGGLRSTNMFLTKTILLLLVVLLGQGGPQEDPQVFERRLSILEKPTNIKMELVSRKLEQNEQPSALLRPYKAGERIYYRISLANVSAEPIAVFVSDPYFQNRPVLTRDGQEVPYRKEVSELVKAKDREQAFERNYWVRLEPLTPKIVGYIDLGDWYDPLELGSYQLVNRHRFVPRGEWVESPVITFEVTLR